MSSFCFGKLYFTEQRQEKYSLLTKSGPLPVFSCPFIYLLSTVVFCAAAPSWVDAVVTVWPEKPKMFPIWPFTENICWLEIRIPFPPSPAAGWGHVLGFSHQWKRSGSDVRYQGYTLLSSTSGWNQAWQPPPLRETTKKLTGMVRQWLKGPQPLNDRDWMSCPANLDHSP